VPVAVNCSVWLTMILELAVVIAMDFRFTGGTFTEIELELQPRNAAHAPRTAVSPRPRIERLQAKDCTTAWREQSENQRDACKFLIPLRKTRTHAAQVRKNANNSFRLPRRKLFLCYSSNYCNCRKLPPQNDSSLEHRNTLVQAKTAALSSTNRFPGMRLLLEVGVANRD
jgi:hypothetical protein